MSFFLSNLSNVMRIYDSAIKGTEKALVSQRIKTRNLFKGIQEYYRKLFMDKYSKNPNAENLAHCRNKEQYWFVYNDYTCVAVNDHYPDTIVITISLAALNKKEYGKGYQYEINARMDYDDGLKSYSNPNSIMIKGVRPQLMWPLIDAILRDDHWWVYKPLKFAEPKKENTRKQIRYVPVVWTKDATEYQKLVDMYFGKMLLEFGLSRYSRKPKRDAAREFVMKEMNEDSVGVVTTPDRFLKFCVTAAKLNDAMSHFWPADDVIQLSLSLWRKRENEWKSLKCRRSIAALKERMRLGDFKRLISNILFLPIQGEVRYVLDNNLSEFEAFKELMSYERKRRKEFSRPSIFSQGNCGYGNRDCGGIPMGHIEYPDDDPIAAKQLRDIMAEQCYFYEFEDYWVPEPEPYQN